MPLRIGFDMDGVLADFASAYRQFEARLFGEPDTPSSGGDPEDEAIEEADANADPVRGSGQRIAHPSELRRRHDAVWQAIERTTDFWTTLKPLESGAVRRIQTLTLRHKWEVFFITQRPWTEGDTVQRQTQRWLVNEGFDLPSVLVIPGSRGAAAGALRLDYHVDDSPRNCVDVKSASGAKPLLVVDPADEIAALSARKLGIGTAESISQCLDILDQATLARTQPTLLHRLATLVGWH